MKNKIDIELQKEIIATVESAMLMYEERWVTPKELSQQFAFFTPNWLKEYGNYLPHKSIVVTTPEGTRKTHNAYPVHCINKMLADGELDNIRVIGATIGQLRQEAM